MAVLIYGSPTTGKSHYRERLASEGHFVLDTDLVLEAVVSAAHGLGSTEFDKAWEIWKNTPTSEQQTTVAVVRLLIEKLQAKCGEELTIVTNLHWDGMKPDHAFGRQPEHMLEIMQVRAKEKGKEISASYATKILTWAPPTLPGLKILPPGRFISDELLEVSDAPTAKEEIARAIGAKDDLRE